MNFRLVQHHFRFRALESVFFPPEKAGNVWRGALGPILRLQGEVGQPYARNRPSGLAEPPRPFVLRAAHLDGKSFRAGEMFSLDVHVFDVDQLWGQRLTTCFERLKVAGIGPRRGRVELAPALEAEVIVVDLAPEPPSRRCSVPFRTPADLKGNADKTDIPFAELFRSARNRLSTLRRIYGEGPLNVDFRGQSESAALVRTLRSDLEYRDIRRRSSRTGAEHGLGGVTGFAEYEGDLGEFLPYLRAAWWTGVGRHTVWGNGVVEIAARSK